MASNVPAQELERVESEWVSNPSPILCARFADLLRQSGRFDEAFKVAEEGLKKWNSNSSIAVVLGKCYLDSGLLEKAMEMFEKVRATQPQNLVVLRGLAEIHYRREDWVRTVDLLEEYLFENPVDEEAREMQERARSMVSNATIDQIFASGEQDEDAAEEAAEETSDEDVFPDTQRMRKVLESQGLDEPGEGEEETVLESDEDAGGHPLEDDPQFDLSRPGSLLEFFTRDEREELHLEDYDGED